jgi:hypothetical protein
VVNSVQSEWFTADAGDVVSVAAGDFDGNEEMDIAVLNGDQTVVIWLQDSEGYNRDYVFTASGATGVQLIDMNADNEADLVVTKDSSEASALYLSDNPVEVAPQPEPEPEPVVEVVVIETTAVESDSGEQTTVVVVKSGGSFGWLGLLLIPLLWRYRQKPQ